MAHDANGLEEELDYDPNTPPESLAVISKRVWEAREYSKAAMQHAFNAHEEVKALRREKFVVPRLLVGIGLIGMVMLAAVLAKVW